MAKATGPWEKRWTPEEAEDGVMPHNAVFDPASGVYREIIEDVNDDEWQGSTSAAAPVRPRHAQEEGRDGDEDLQGL
jgi:hypothetical protein